MTGRVPPRLLLVIGFAAGAVTFLLGAVRHPVEAWTVYLVNFLFWSGLAAAGVVFAALLELTHARWAKPLRPVAERFAAFLPAAVVLYLLLLPGARVLFPWVAHPPAAHPTWFTLRVFAIRDIVALLILVVSSFWFIRRSAEREREDLASPRATAAAVFLLIVYAISFSLLAVDLVMSMQPGWTSTLFPAYVFTGNLYGAIAAVAIVAAARVRFLADAAAFDAPIARDAGKLLLGFALLWLYLFWSQYLTTWYGNLPHEFDFLVARMRGAWWVAAWLVFCLCFAIPFLVLLARWAKRPRSVQVVALVCLAGLWLERLVLIANGRHLDSAALWIGGGVTLAFAAVFALSQIPPRDEVFAVTQWNGQ
jgi:hypothetical protein